MDYQIRQFQPADRGSFEELYRAVYGEQWREKTNLRWTVDSSRAGSGAAVAVSGARVVAAQPYCDLPLHTPWGARSATLLLDVATHPEHQRRGLFKGVVHAAREAAFERGASIAMTTPNPIAARGFRTMSGWVRLCSLDCLFLPLGAGAPVAGAGPVVRAARRVFSAASVVLHARAHPQDASSATIESPWSPGLDADEMWHRFAPAGGIMIPRDRLFLRWRFGSDYRLFLARDGQGPVGFAAARVVTRAGFKLGMVIDCAGDAKDQTTLRLLLAAVRWLKDEGASAAIGYFLRGSPPWSFARVAGFLRVPPAFAPRAYPVYVGLPTTNGNNAHLLDTSIWHMSLADSDLV